jgi:hypothetical protein
MTRKIGDIAGIVVLSLMAGYKLNAPACGVRRQSEAATAL